MYEKDRHIRCPWLSLILVVTIGRFGLVRCSTPPVVASARKLSSGATAMDYNHIFNPLSTVADGLSGSLGGESVKFSASKSHVLDLHQSLRKTVDATSAGNWRARKPLAKPSPASRSRINNRSMTRFSEVEIPAGMQQLDAPPQPAVQKSPTNITGLAELYRSAEKSRGLENFFWKYFVDSDVSASTDDTEAIDYDSQATMDADGTKSAEARKKKFHIKKKYKKFLIPLLLAYKIKFLALVPAIIGGLILLVKSAGLAGFFFALFTAVVSLKKY
ncbi:uncharacterized protein LOC118456348 [Anopheles albimanus]|uniref:Uncharacterized protein n=1 Tax=Anopheles albimanus TaxID=7167 RepID=A0A182F8J7_ANOAL|nr:uncharacterized protein LOC118456348 [Anopheles albimanus]